MTREELFARCLSIFADLSPDEGKTHNAALEMAELLDALIHDKAPDADH